MARQPNPANPISALMAEYNFMKGKDSNRQIAQTVLCNMTKLPSFTLEDAAELCNVSVSTFLRFCKDMGYTSYTDFKARFSEELPRFQEKYGGANRTDASDWKEPLRALLLDEIGQLLLLERTLDSAACTRLAQRLHKAQKVFVFDIRYSTPRIRLQCQLAYSGKRVYFSADHDEQLLMLREMDAQSLLLIDYTNSSRDSALPELLPRAVERGAQCAAICHEAPFANSTLCDPVIRLGISEGAISASEILWPYLSALYARQELE